MRKGEPETPLTLPLALQKQHQKVPLCASRCNPPKGSLLALKRSPAWLGMHYAGAFISLGAPQLWATVLWCFLGVCCFLFCGLFVLQIQVSEAAELVGLLVM